MSTRILRAPAGRPTSPPGSSSTSSGAKAVAPTADRLLVHAASLGCTRHRSLSASSCRNPVLSFCAPGITGVSPVSYTHLRAHETDSYLVCRLLLEKKKK